MNPYIMQHGDDSVRLRQISCREEHRCRDLTLPLVCDAVCLDDPARTMLTLPHRVKLSNLSHWRCQSREDGVAVPKLFKCLRHYCIRGVSIVSLSALFEVMRNFIAFIVYRLERISQ